MWFKNLVQFHVRVHACMPLHMVVIRGQFSRVSGNLGPNSAAWGWQQALYPLSHRASPTGIVLRDVPDSCIRRCHLQVSSAFPACYAAFSGSVTFS